MLVSICGTPGVGKTTAASMLADHGWEIIQEKDLISDLSLFDEIDMENGELIVEPDILRKGFRVWAEKLTADTVLEGHLSYLAPADLVLLMRIDPLVVRERLLKRDYSEDKITDNVEAEALGYIFFRCCEEEENALLEKDWKEMGKGQALLLERDVTDLSPEAISEWFLEMIGAFRDKKLKMISLYRPGKVDWLEAYAEWF